MVVISISLTESVEQIVSGIPKSISVDVNTPATIFYTLDGSTPTLLSTIYTGPISLPTDKLVIILKVMATNGVDFSPIIEETYGTDMLDNTRLPHSATDSASESISPGLYPFGTNSPQPNGEFLSPGDASITINDPAKTQIPSGYDGSGGSTGFTNKPYNIENYNIVYSTRDANGQSGKGVGNLPGNTTVTQETPAPEFTNAYSSVFDPRAFVIFQDVSKEDPTEPPHINRQFFSMENSERVRDGNNFFNSGLDAPPVTGSFLRSHYNPRDNTITYYYLDTTMNKWIISKTPYQPSDSPTSNLSGVIGTRSAGSKYVFEWIPFTRRVLF